MADFNAMEMKLRELREKGPIYPLSESPNTLTKVEGQPDALPGSHDAERSRRARARGRDGPYTPFPAET